VWVHLYGESKVSANLDKDRKIILTQRTNYPWSGEVNIRIFPDTQTSFTLFLRIPGWCENAEVLINGKHVGTALEPASYFPLRREWKRGDEVRLNLPMSVDFLEMHPHSINNGRMAISRGPLIYCIESADHPNVDIFDVLFPPDANFSPRFDPHLLGGVTVLEGNALLRDKSEWEGRLYRIYRKERKASWNPIGVTAVPYFTWGNREIGKMLVWMPRGY